MVEAVGLIGLGNAGSALAEALLRKTAVVGYDVDPKRIEIAKKLGVECVPSVEAVAAQVDTVILSLPKPDISRAVVAALVGAENSPKHVIETSTITPKVAQDLHSVCRAAGIGFIDAAIGGGVQSMAAGEVTFLVGGGDADVAASRPVLEMLARTIHHLGPVGAGSGAKVVNNGVMHALMVVLIEAGAMAKQLGIAMPKLQEILGRSDGIMRPLEHRFGDRMQNGDYVGGMSVSNARKDSTLALETAQDLGVPLFATLAAHTPYEIAEQLGQGEMDYSSLAKLWETWCGIDFAEK